jgi:raffinose/stachyose/melibiose transport system substrate-binding protein
MLRGAMAVAVLTVVGTIAGSAWADPVTLKMESWRSEDAKAWNDVIIPAFEKAHPDIKIEFTPTEPTQFDATLASKLAAGTAGDIISCRAFDNALNLYNKGYLASVKDLKAVANFPASKLVAWQTDDGSDTFCLPMVGSIHGFIYNKKAFSDLGLTEPKTEDEFFGDLDKIKADGRYVPLAIGSKDTWALGTMGYLNIGPQSWKGEEGRQAIINGTAKFTDPQFVHPLDELAKWSKYMADGYQAQGYSDSQQQFTLGRAAIYPAGSWEIPGFRAQADFDMGAFKVPVEKDGDQCYVTDHTDLGIGMNKATAHPNEVREFLEWTGTPEFAQLLADSLPGLFPLSNAKPTFKDPLATTFISWRDQCKTTIRLTYQIIGRHQPNIDDEVAQVSANVVNGTQTPADAAAQLQKDLASWYKPQQGK